MTIPVIDWAGTDLFKKFHEMGNEDFVDSTEIAYYQNIEEIDGVLEIIEKDYSSFKR